MLLLRIAAILLITTASAFAQNVRTDTKAIPNGDYVLDPAHTSITFHVLHLGYSYFTGRFDKTSGKVTVDSQKPDNSKLEVSIDPASIDPNHDQLQNILKSDQWFNVGQFPTMSFVAKKIEQTGQTTGKVTGDFTMHGVTKPVTLDVTLNGWGEDPIEKKIRLGFSAKGSLNRSDFGITNSIPMVGDQVTFEIQTEFQKM